MAQADRALYLAWRPRTFADVVGQQHVVQTIRNAVLQGTLAHAYLFAGPRGTGKTTMARLLFKAVNCLDPRDGAPDERCAICVSANEGSALDLIEMDAASNRGIDDVRDLRDKINYAPGEARYRVYILDEAHQLTQPAWDALLKTLEEPPPHAILVLATTEAHKVPATVLSRCQRFDFHRISAVDIRDRLAAIARQERIDVEPTVLAWLARAARGGMRDAIGLLDQLRAFSSDRIDAAEAREVLGLAGLETIRPFLLALEDDRPGEAVEELSAAVERGTDLRVYVSDALAYLRALLLLRYGARSALLVDFPTEEIAWLEERVTAWEAGRLRALVGGFGDAMARFRDPGQLMIQVELILLAGQDPPDAGPVPSPRFVAIPAAAEPRTAEPRPTSGTGQEVDGAQQQDAPASMAETPASGRATFPPPRGAEGTRTRPNRSDVEKNALAEPPTACQSTPADSPLDAADLRDRWPRIQAEIAAARLDRSWFYQCALLGVDGQTLLLRLDPSLRAFVEGRERRMTLERELGRILKRPVSVRMFDEADAAAPAAGRSGDETAMEDPVVRAAVRLFGGPLRFLDTPAELQSPTRPEENGAPDGLVDDDPESRQ